MNTAVGSDITMEQLKAENDCVYLGTGAWKQPVIGVASAIAMSMYNLGIGASSLYFKVIEAITGNGGMRMVAMVSAVGYLILTVLYSVLKEADLKK